MDKPIQVVIADDHPILLEGLRKLLEAENDIAVVGQAFNGHEALEVTRRVEPSILLLDLAMPGLPGLEVLRALSGSSLPTRTILLTASIDRDDIVKALQLGARGLVLKESASQLLMKAMRMVMAGEYWIGRDPRQCSIVLDDRMLSPRHARLHRDAKGRWHIENAQSLNGLWLRITEIALERGGHFQCGEQRFQIKVL